MKKKISMLVMLFALLLSIGSVASAYDKYLGGDMNYELIDAHQGTAWYLDISSIIVKTEAPPNYCIAAIVIQSNEDESTSSETYTWAYNESTQIMCYWNERFGEWINVPRYGDSAHTRVVLPGGKLAYYMAEQLPFFHK